MAIKSTTTYDLMESGRTTFEWLGATARAMASYPVMAAFPNPAIRLMGADAIISGVRPQIAQTIVHLGLDLQGIVTKASLVRPKLVRSVHYAEATGNFLSRRAAITLCSRPCRHSPAASLTPQTTMQLEFSSVARAWSDAPHARLAQP